MKELGFCKMETTTHRCEPKKYKPQYYSVEKAANIINKD